MARVCRRVSVALLYDKCSNRAYFGSPTYSVSIRRVHTNNFLIFDCKECVTVFRKQAVVVFYKPFEVFAHRVITPINSCLYIIFHAKRKINTCKRVLLKFFRARLHDVCYFK